MAFVYSQPVLYDFHVPLHLPDSVIKVLQPVFNSLSAARQPVKTLPRGRPLLGGLLFDYVYQVGS